MWSLPWSLINHEKNEIAEEIGTAQPKEDSRVIIADLFGEGVWESDNREWKLNFERGVSKYPLPLQKAYITQKSTLAHIYQKTKVNASSLAPMLVQEALDALRISAPLRANIPLSLALLALANQPPPQRLFMPF